MEMNKQILNKTRLRALSNKITCESIVKLCAIYTVGSFTEMSNEKSNLQIKLY